jgi:2-methylcitrate dehydratase PrpD
MVAGVFSSALVAARLMGLDARRTADALGIAGSSAGGLLAFLGTAASTKQLHPGFASQAGILAARLAEAGATGPETVFDGPHGVFDALADGGVDAGAIVRDLGRTWETTRIGIKPWPACQLSDATMAAALDVVEREAIDPADVVAIDAQVHPDSAPVVCDPTRDLAHPRGSYAAKFSLPWSVAAAVVDRRVGIGTYADSSLARPEVAEIATRVRWQVTAAPTTVAADAPGDVVITLSDGRRVSGHVDRSPGGGDVPLDRPALLAKFETNVGAPAPELVTAVETLEQAPDLEHLVHLAARALATTSSLEKSR